MSFYHADLVGMEAFSPSGEALGTVVTVHDYGAGVSLEIVQGRQSRVVPFTRACVPHVDMSQSRLEVMLPAEIEVEGDLSTMLKWLCGNDVAGGYHHSFSGIISGPSGYFPDGQGA